MKLLLIRHGATKGNLEYRYLGSTDEDILPEEEVRLEHLAKSPDPVWGKALQNVRRVYISPMLRCRHTAEILFPKLEKTAVDELKECEFGRFEYRNYSELNGDPDYQRFIDSGGICGFPGGETQVEFIERTEAGFQKLGLKGSDVPTAFVVHGGTIMALLAAFGEPKQPYFSRQIKNGEAYLVNWDGDVMTDIRKIEKNNT